MDRMMRGGGLYKRVGTWIAPAVLVAAGATGYLMGQAPTAPKKKPAPVETASTPGRYQIVFNPNVRADTFLLDTATGKTWVHTAITDVKGHPMIWVDETRVDSDQEFIEWIKHQVLSPEANTNK